MVTRMLIMTAPAGRLTTERVVVAPSAGLSGMLIWLVEKLPVSMNVGFALGLLEGLLEGLLDALGLLEGSIDALGLLEGLLDALGLLDGLPDTVGLLEGLLDALGLLEGLIDALLPPRLLFLLDLLVLLVPPRLLGLPPALPALPILLAGSSASALRSSSIPAASGRDKPTDMDSCSRARARRRLPTIPWALMPPVDAAAKMTMAWANFMVVWGFVIYL